MIAKTFLLLMLAALLPSCLYILPEDDSLSTVPVINNPSVYRDSGPTPLPGVGI